MNGTLLAVLGAILGALALLAFQGARQPRRAVKSEPRQATDAVTRDEIEARFKDYEQRTQWLLDEWYEKFNTLHARLAKRAARAAPPPPPNGVDQDEQQPLPSVLQFRRLGSP